MITEDTDPTLTELVREYNVELLKVKPMIDTYPQDQVFFEAKAKYMAYEIAEYLVRELGLR